MPGIRTQMTWPRPADLSAPPCHRIILRPRMSGKRNPSFSSHMDVGCPLLVSVKPWAGRGIAREYLGPGFLYHCSDISLRKLSVAVPVVPVGLTDGLIDAQNKGTVCDPRVPRRDGPAWRGAGPLGLVPRRAGNCI